MARSLKRIVAQCDGCTLPDIFTGTCTAFIDPEYQWRNYDPKTKKGDKCWGRCDSAQDMVERLESMLTKATNNPPLRRELKAWKEIAARKSV